MGRDLVAQIAHFGTTARLGQAVTHLAQLLNERVNLLLLAIDLRIELVEQIFSEAGFDLEINQAVFNWGGNVHGLYWT
jgi:chemotaxis protein CheY-P-specific phosphatase CheC